MRTFMIGILSAIALLATGGVTAHADTPLPRADREDDLRQLEKWVSMEQSFSKAKRQEAERAITGHRKNRTQFSDAEFYMEVRRIVALANNGHSNVPTWPIHVRFGLLPLRTFWFSDGMYVVRVRKPHQDLLGARIEGIDGRPLADLATRLKDYHGGSIGYFRHYTAASLMLSPALLHAIGLSENSDRLTLQVKVRTGEIVEVELGVDRESSAVRARPWRYLHPAPIASPCAAATPTRTPVCDPGPTSTAISPTSRTVRP